MGWPAFAMAALLLQPAPEPDRAGWPMPAVAERFIAAMAHADIQSARATLTEGAAITSTLGNRGEFPATLADAQSYLRGCHGYFARTMRELENPRARYVDISWDCPGQMVNPMLLTVLDGRLVAVRVGGGIPSVARYQLPMEARASNFLVEAVAELSFDRAAQMLAPNAIVRDMRTGRDVRIPDIVAYVEGCAMRGISSTGTNEATVNWTCPDGNRTIVVGAENYLINRLELGRPNS
jgi:hypothetical protein